MSTRSLRVELEPTVLRWARERAGLSDQELAKKAGVAAGQVEEWERTGRLRIRQVERLASATHTPVGFLYLHAPPQETLPLPDFRVVAGATVDRPSPELIDVLDDAERRQAWYRDYVLSSGGDPLDFVGSLTPNLGVVDAADRIRIRHGITSELRATIGTWEDALRLEIERIEASGAIVVRNGVVGNNTSRPLNVDEFRGFAIADQYAPLIFLNARDAKAAQMFTLMHELVHVWQGQSGISNLTMTLPSGGQAERFSNAVAAEVLVPSAELEEAWALRRGSPTLVAQLARAFKVSSLVILRRLLDARKLDPATFQQRYAHEEERFRQSGSRAESGGDFYRTQTARASRRFATAVIAETLEGRTSHKDAFRLLGIRSSGTFDEFARRLGLMT